jgi:tetraprenyl-beta-curcumene synthase
VRALAAAAVRQLAWSSRLAEREVRAWLMRAMHIPAAAIRRDAVNALTYKRGHIDGAALFSVIPVLCPRMLVRLLVAYQVMFDFLDSANERAVAMGIANGRQLHLALVDALDQRRPLSDYYFHHPWGDDGGFLDALVDTCRNGCAALPRYATVQRFVVAEARRFEVLALNHEADPTRRIAALQDWARRERTGPASGPWYELTAARSSSLAIHALLALSVERAVDAMEVSLVRRAYTGVLPVMGTMLDSYVDQLEDRTNGDHSYVGHYPNSDMAVKRLGQILRCSLREALALPNGERHAVIVACMTALYLSKDSARSGELRDGTASLVAAGGSLTRLLVPVLRAWRLAYSQSSS